MKKKTGTVDRTERTKRFHFHGLLMILKKDGFYAFENNWIKKLFHYFVLMSIRFQC